MKIIKLLSSPNGFEHFEDEQKIVSLEIELLKLNYIFLYRNIMSPLLIFKNGRLQWGEVRFERAHGFF